jgi:hypothetical protein
MFVKTKDGQLDRIYNTITDFRRDNSNVSFSKEIPNSVLASYDVYPVIRLVTPEFNSLVQSLVIQSTPTEVDGVWSIGYDVVQKSEEIATRNVRRERDRLLTECDWVTLKAADTNTSVDEAWATYRQALRDITAQDGFPYSVTWPTKP